MEPRSLSIALPVLTGMAALVILHVAIWRMSPSPDPRVGLLGRLALGGVGLSVLANGFLAGFNGPDLCAVLWIDALAVTCYFFVYAGVARSVSMTLLSRLLRCQGGSLDVETLVNEYAASARFEDRVEVMRRIGLVRVAGKTVALTPKGAAVSRGVRMLSTLMCSDVRG